MVALAWGTLRLLSTWFSARISEESGWGFGQVIALSLLGLPLLSFSEELLRSKYSLI